MLSLLSKDWCKFGLLTVLILVSGYLIATKKTLINTRDTFPNLAKPNPITTKQPLTIGNTQILVEVRTNDAERELGLSNRTSLNPNEGMIFIYNKPQPVIYWMKGMRFALDFIWIANGQVIQIHENIPFPTTDNPVNTTVTPKSPINAVIEVNAGFVKAHQIKVGDQVKYAF